MLLHRQRERVEPAGQSITRSRILSPERRRVSRRLSFFSQPICASNSTSSQCKVSAMGRITLITGGARSGKSTHALKLASARGPRRAFVATAEALDTEMVARIAHHKANRPSDFRTIEEPVNIASALEALKGRTDVVLIDCLTLWVSNLMRVYSSEHAFRFESETLAKTLVESDFESLVVTDEVGAGIVPDNETARRFRDLLGMTNQVIARAADEVILMVAGYALKVK
jgi:adenosylcobinamide kinase/adenosylcobinamide-phosphate guanylyltransferase